MSTVQPPQPPALPPSGATAQPVAQTVKAPPAVSQLPQGQSLPATVTQAPPPATGASGQPVPQPATVQTPLGLVELKTTFNLPPNANLTLVVLKGGPLPQFLITGVNGKPVPTAQGLLKAATPPAPPTQSAPAPILREGANLNATLLRPAPGALQPQPTPQAPQAPATPNPAALAPQPGQAPHPPTTAQSAPNVAPQPAPTAPGAPAPTTPSPAPASPATSGQPAQPAPATPHNAAAPQTLPSGTRFQVNVQRFDAPQAPLSPQPSSSPALSQGAVVAGTVRGVTPQGQPIVQAPNVTLALNAAAEGVEGARVVLKLGTPPQLPKAGPVLGHAAQGADGLAQAKGWPGLDEALKTLAAADPTRSQQVMQNVLPQAGSKLTTQMLFFMSALKGGDFKSWIGETAGRVIERDRPGVMARVSGDFQVLARLADEPQQNDWRLALIPFLNGQAVEQLRMYYRGRGGAEDDGNGEDETRFVLDLDLSNIGHLQIDGLVKSESKRLDLIIRTETAMDEDWRTDITNIFVDAQNLMGLEGGVRFQTAPDTFVEFPPIDGGSQPNAPGLFV